ncbi:MAG: ATP-dependent helicase [Verrucomicrobiota bacterium]
MAFDYTLNPTPSTVHARIDYAKELNPEQMQAVTAAPGPLLVVAGAGSGKTRALTYRVAWLIEQGVSPENILLLTFTNKASCEMLERVTRLLPRNDTSHLWGGTFHHVGNRFLRKHASAIGLRNDFSILDRDDSSALIKTCLEDAGLTKDKQFPKADVILQVMSFATNTQKNIGEVLRLPAYAHLHEFAEKISAIEKRYMHKKTETNVVDYDDLLTLPLKIFKENAEALERYQQKFQHILVDEYQDTNILQAELVDLLAAKHHHLMAVGDDAQSIYSWRGANFANIISFQKRYLGATLVRLETNYRSVPEILALANTTIAQNEVKIPKNLRSIRPSGIKPALVALPDGNQQAHFIAQRITEMIEEGVEPHEIAVLYRAHFHSMEVQMELTRQQIPFQITSGLRFFEQAHVKDVAACLRYALNPQDEVSFRRVCLLLPGIGAKTASKIWTQLRDGKSWEQISIPEKTISSWKDWGALNVKLRSAENTPSLLVGMIVDDFYEPYLKLAYTDYLERKADLEQLQNFAETFDNTEDFLSQLALLTNVDGENGAATPFQESIRLSTIHQAKGLEFKIVFLIMLCDGMFPSFRSIETRAGEEEERRLFYVGITRAKDELYLTYPKIRYGGKRGDDMYQSPSRFLDDFPRKLCNVWNIQHTTPFD